MADCRKSFKVHMLIDAVTGRVGTFDKPLRTEVRFLRERWKRHGKKGRRANKQERAPKDYPTRWWDQR